MSLDSIDKCLNKLCCFSKIIYNTINYISLAIVPDKLNNDKN